MLKQLLEKSSDLLIAVDLENNIILGKRLATRLKETSVNQQHAINDIKEILENNKVSNEFSFLTPMWPLEASAFTILHQLPGHILFIAEDKTLQNKFISAQEKGKRIHALLDESSDPIFSFMADGTYLYVNKVFASTMGSHQDQIIGKKIWDIFDKEEADKRFAMVKNTFKTGETGNIEVRVPLPTGDKFFLTTVKPIKNHDQKVDFIICISKDITELRQTQDQLTTLKGIIPICSSCKCIRNDGGAWQQLEEYVASRSEAEFSHGICPDCAKQLYPDFYKEK